MAKICIIGDIHLQERVPAGRKDDYLTNVLNKLDYVLSKFDYVVCLGDIFSSYKNSDYVFYRIHNILNKYPNKFYTILGNHDICGRNHSDLSSCTINNLHNVGALQIKTKPFFIENVNFAVSLVDKSNIDEIPIDVNNTDILLGHNYFDFNLCMEESLTREEIRKLNYRYILLGHDHSEYEDEFIGNSILYRLGSFSRNDTQSYNEYRQIKCCVYDTKTEEMEKVVIPILPKEEVFIDNVFNKKSIRSEINFTKIGEVLSKFNKIDDEDVSILKNLKRMNTPDKYIRRIKHHHEINGVSFF